jgi:hypothetical protein
MPWRAGATPACHFEKCVRFEQGSAPTWFKLRRRRPVAFHCRFRPDIAVRPFTQERMMMTKKTVSTLIVAALTALGAVQLAHAQANSGRTLRKADPYTDGARK